MRLFAQTHNVSKLFILWISKPLTGRKELCHCIINNFKKVNMKD